MSANPYKDTLQLPVTDFPMRADLVKREPARLEQWDAQDLYGKIQAKREGAEKYILHDGPPFANGDVHMGTALNKILKDLILKSKTMAGYHCPFIPGWDCHGLPIEFKVMQENKDLAPADIRTRSEEFARSFIDIQRKSFKRLGVLADWQNPYLTLDPAYEADVLRCFAAFVSKDLVYRANRPVQWSYGAQTALAEAEVEYKDKKSPAIFVQFAPASGKIADLGASMVIWTTTPWTLPANVGIAVHPKFTYVSGTFTHEDGRSADLVLAKSLLEQFAEKTGFTATGDLTEFTGSDLEGSEAQHPFLDRTSKIILGDFVTDDAGTGAVHIAPGHGQDDYVAGLANGLEVLSPVDNNGLFTDEVGVAELVGLHVFKGNTPITELLEASGHLLGSELHSHEYPHCWRSKTPIIFRAVPQYFIRIEDFRKEALDEIQNVSWLPHWAQKRISGTVESRPDWCISRQRTWGVPLPVFYDQSGEPIIDAALANKVADIVQEHGTNLWFEEDDEQWNARLDLPAGTTRGKDTLDVWIDSGCSHAAVLDKHPELSAPADLYLEATDQHRGWFQSSLMVSMAVRDTAPYKQVLTHGFVVDTTGKKISKSDAKKGKPMDAAYYYDKYGADMVRLWVSSVDYKQEVPFSEKLFTQNADTYRRIRNTLRILLGNLNGFDASKDAVAPADLDSLDRWILERLHTLTTECVAAYEAFEFRKVFTALNQFCASDLSNIYIDVTKDRLYCDSTSSLRRRSSQTAIAQITDVLCRLLAPVLAYTADEAWEHLGHDTPVHLEDFPTPDPEFAPSELSEQMAALLKLREVAQAAIDDATKAGTFKKRTQAKVALTIAEADQPTGTLPNEESLLELFMVAELELTNGSETTATASVTTLEPCPRCWRSTPIPAESETCPRCAEALA